MLPMKILHGTWIPNGEDGFVQTGGFYLWAETTESKKRSKKASKADSNNVHPRQLAADELEAFLMNDVGVKGHLKNKLQGAIAPKYFLLPTRDNQPLPSLELARYLEEELPETFEFQYWQIDCYKTTASVKTGTYSHADVTNVVKFLNDLHFMALHSLVDVQFGADLLFWYHYTQTLKEIILKDQYIPALKYREIQPNQTGKQKTKTADPVVEIYAGWDIISEKYEANLQRYSEYMPALCVSGFTNPGDTIECFDKVELLRHFSEYVLADIVTHTISTAEFDKRIADSIVQRCFRPTYQPETGTAALTQYQQWQIWRDKISRTQSATSFYLCFQLSSPKKEEEEWQLQFLVTPKQDPSLKLALVDYWRLSRSALKEAQKQLGTNFEKNLLLNLGYAARMYPKLWDGLETDRPIGLPLNLAEAFEFLKEAAWVLEDAGYKVIVPSWYTPQGRRRARIRLNASRKGAGSKKSKSYLSLETLVQYEYELSIGGERVSEKEWQQLVDAKTPLVKFRGEWVELDQDKLKDMLEFWQTHQEEKPDLSLLDLMKLSAEGEDGIELDVDRDEALADMLAKLNDKNRMEPIADLPQLHATLRDYQKRGVSWLHYLESLGLNGCLADDMGLGKTIQVIARLVQERADQKKAVPPTLLVVPTSVVGNWRKEIEKFAPHLQTVIHHGGDRPKDEEGFRTACQGCDVVITSFTLARKDEKLLSATEWHRVVVDEAQNIKNPKTAQTKAILKLPARHRLALTGTPVENRLLDLWSIFNFLNPGYLGKEAQFRKSFELPIQKDNDRMRSATLKKLVEPFILRRVKTDQSIIRDLPDKVEQTLYCNLTKEQASLYEAVVKDVEKKLAETEGIQRKGLILSTLMKLKQICNHPMQFLQDSSEFSAERSHKLSRLIEMVEEVMDEGESLLIFSQFTDICEAIEKHFKHTHHYNTYYLHGGTSSKKREQMIAEFQDLETDPSIFVLSLKAGGVGITLTKANHVFHFDRWWNPAVEDQASDRAFRIGQKKNVFVHKFVAIGTLEERIDQMIADKKKLAGAIVGADESWLTELDNDAFKELISLNRSAILE
jgi:SNF2 family DNA or RNA helicase